MIYRQESRQKRNCSVNETVKIPAVFGIHKNVKKYDERIIDIIKNINK
jgi:hypothetical protein